EDAAVALDGRQHRQADAGIAGRSLDDRAAGPQQAPPLGIGHHGLRDAVLDAAAGILRFNLRVDARRQPLGDTSQSHQRRLADRLQDGFMHWLTPFGVVLLVPPSGGFAERRLRAIRRPDPLLYCPANRDCRARRFTQSPEKTLTKNTANGSFALSLLRRIV